MTPIDFVHYGPAQGVICAVTDRTNPRSTSAQGVGWGLHPHTLISGHLRDGSLLEFVPNTSLDVPLYWQQARAASSLLDGLTHEVLAAASSTLLRG